MADRKTDIWMPLYINDYLGDTMHLSRDEHGAYLLLLMAYWKLRGPLPDDPASLAAIARASLDEWLGIDSNARSTPVQRPLSVRLLPFFKKGDDGCWHHKRVDEELDKAKANIEQKRRAAAASVNARYNARYNGRSTAVPTDVPTATPTEGQRRVNPSPSPSPIGLGNTHPPTPRDARNITQGGVGEFFKGNGNGRVGRIPSPEKVRAFIAELDREIVTNMPGAAIQKICEFVGLNPATARKAANRTDISVDMFEREYEVVYSDNKLDEPLGALAYRLRLTTPKRKNK